MAIYGVEWSGGRSTRFTRTDDASEFSDPIPYVKGSTSYSSPFDTISPWKDIKKSEDGNWVKIPKFWYKWTKIGDSLKLQISNKSEEGFKVSPTHSSRDDGKGTRSYIYIGRYLSSVLTYLPESGTYPMFGLDRSTARYLIHTSGDTIWMQDFATYWTIRMLYLVEFADWNSQDSIGIGVNDPVSLNMTGYTDDMPYHTGTTAATKSSPGYCQYRWIEGLIGGNAEYIDGIRFEGSEIYIQKNPLDFSDSEGGILIAERCDESGCIKSWAIPDPTKYSGAKDYPWALFPESVSVKAKCTFKGTCTWSELIAKTDAQENDIWRVKTIGRDTTGGTYEIFNDYVCKVAETPGESSWRLREADDRTYSYGEYCADHYATNKNGIILYAGAKFNEAHNNGLFFLNASHGNVDTSYRRSARAMKLP